MNGESVFLCRDHANRAMNEVSNRLFLVDLSDGGAICGGVYHDTRSNVSGAAWYQGRPFSGCQLQLIRRSICLDRHRTAARLSMTSFAPRCLPQDRECRKSSLM